jgi:hypothetical protein
LAELVNEVVFDRSFNKLDEVNDVRAIGKLLEHFDFSEAELEQFGIIIKF